MALYINDAEVSRLVEELAQSTGDNKTEIVRRLLREEAHRLQRRRTAGDRLRRLEEISRRAAKISRESNPPFSYSKKDADEMFSYLESGAKTVARRKRRTA
jgi:hypothetical protein